jgi:hypothetical protein
MISGAFNAARGTDLRNCNLAFPSSEKKWLLPQFRADLPYTVTQRDPAGSPGRWGRGSGVLLRKNLMACRAKWVRAPKRQKKAFYRSETVFSPHFHAFRVGIGPAPLGSLWVARANFTNR